MFQEELAFFISNQDELVQKYRGKALIIKGKQVLGVHESALDAYLEAQTKYEPGSFMIQMCEPGPEAYTVTITSTSITC